MRTFARGIVSPRVNKNILCPKTCCGKNRTRNSYEVEKDPDEIFGQKKIVREIRSDTVGSNTKDNYEWEKWMT